MSDPQPPTARSGPSKRDFLVGTVAGGVLLQAAHLVRGGRAAATPTPTAPEKFHVSYAQAGEDLVVAWIMNHLGIVRPTYLDIGAYDPVDMSNTYLLYKRGGRGVLVEPNPDLTPRLAAVRPGDTVLPVGIGVSAETAADYYRMSEPSWNTFDKGQADHCVRETGGRVTVREVIKMPLVPVNEVIAQHFPAGAPDFFSIDIEGLDLAILKTLDWQRRRPKVICAETLVTATDKESSETGRFLLAQGYHHRGGSFANAVFVDSRVLGRKG